MRRIIASEFDIGSHALRERERLKGRNRDVRSFCTAAVVLTVLASVAPARAQVIRGVLLDDATDATVGGATLTLLDEDGEVSGQTLANDRGVFFLEAELGVYQLRAERIGYRTTTSLPFRVAALDTVAVEFRIDAEAVLLSALTVTVGGPPGHELFEERMATEEGFFFTPEMVDSLRPTQHVGEIFRHADRTWVHWGWGRHEDGATGPLPHVYTYLGHGCLRFIVDRTPVPEPFFERSIWGVPPLSDLTPDDLVAIEVYRAWHEVPEDFRKQLRIRNRWEQDALNKINRKQCGVVIIWTRHGW